MLILLLFFSTAFSDNLKVEYSPDRISGVTPLHITFSEPMIISGYPADSVPDGLLLTPFIQGIWRWNSQSTLIFSPDSAWCESKRYTVTIPAGVSSKISGNSLKQKFTKVIPAGSFSGKIINPVDMRSTVSFVEIRFNKPVHPDSLRRHIFCKTKPLELLTSDSLLYRIRPKSGWNEGADVTFTVDTELTPCNGNIKLDSALSTRFNVSDTIRFLGLFRNDQKVSQSDTLFLEDEYSLRFSHQLSLNFSNLSRSGISDYVLVNGKTEDKNSKLRIESNRILLQDLPVPGKPVTLTLLAGLPSQDSAFLFNDLKLELIGDSNRIDSKLPEYKIKEVFVFYNEKDSIPKTPLSIKTPVRLLPDMQFELTFEIKDSSECMHRSGQCYCFTPDGTDSLDLGMRYLHPKKLPSNANCTLVVKAGNRMGHYQLKKDFIKIFRTGCWEFCLPVIKGWNEYFRGWPDNEPYHFVLPQEPAVPLECYGKCKIIAETRPVATIEKLFPCDSTGFKRNIIHFDTLTNLTSDSGYYKYIPLNLAPVLSTNGYGTADVSLTVNNKKYNKFWRFVVTDLGVKLIKSRLSTAVAVTSLTKRQPVAGAGVTFLGKKNRVLAKGETDSTGFFEVPHLFEPNLIVVSKSDDTLVYYLEERYISDENDESEELNVKDTVMGGGIIITDRQWYHPGDTLLFKGIVRTLKDSWEPVAGYSAVVQIDWEKAQKYIDTLPVSGCGSFHGTVEVPAGAALKWYTINVNMLHDSGSISSGFNVSEFRSAELSAAVIDTAVDNDSIRFTVSAKWLHGGAARKSLTTWKCRSAFSDPLYGDLNENLHSKGTKYSDKTETETTGSGVLDSAGRLVAAIARLPYDSGRVYQFTATVNGSTVQSAKIRGPFVQIPHPHRLYVSIQRNPYLFAGDTGPFLLKIVHEDGRPAEDIRLCSEIIHEKPVKKNKKNRCGLPLIIHDTVHEKIRTDFSVTDSLGIVKLSIVNLSDGTYSLVVRFENDSVNEPFTKKIYISTPDTSAQRLRCDNYNLNNGISGNLSESFKIVEIDTGIHNAGDIVHLQIKAPQDSCNVLLTVSRDNMYEHRWISMAGRDTVVSINIIDKYIPVVKVEATVFPPLKRTSKGLAFRQNDLVKDTSVNIHVSTASRCIPVKVRTDRNNYAPGDSVTVHIAIPSKLSSATALVMTVDEGVLQIGNTSVPDICSAFTRDTSDIFYSLNECYFADTYGPFDYDSCNALRLRPRSLSGDLMTLGLQDKNEFYYLDSYISGVSGIPDLIGNLMGGDGGCLYLKRKLGVIELRNPVRPCAYFNPNVKFDQSGNAFCKFKLPGNLSRWRVTAIVDDTASFGVDTICIESSKPLMVRPQIPRFLRVGDSASAVYIVENRSKNELHITSGAIVCGDTAVDTFTLKKDELRSLNVSLIGKSARTDSILFLVRGDTLSDGIKTAIPTIFETPRNVVATSGSTTDSNRFLIKLPEPVTIDSGNLEMSLSTTRMQNLREGVQYLFDYPYGCLEQQSSKIMPLLMLGDLATRFNLRMLAKGDESDVISNYLDHIAGFQNKSDGGLGYWPSDQGHSCPWLTASVLEIMIKAKSSGYTINGDVYKKAVEYIIHQTRQLKASRNAMFIDSYFQLVKTLSGNPDRSELHKLYNKRNDLPLSAKINLLRAMYAAGHYKREVSKLQKLLLRGLIEKDRLAYVGAEESRGFEYCHESPVRQTALVLEALLQTGSQSRYDEPMIRWLTKQRRSGRWRTTQENMVVFRAFTAYTNVYERDFPKLHAAVRIAGNDWFSAALEGREGVLAQAEMSLDSIFSHGETDVSICSKGSGRLYYDLLMSTFPAGKAPPASSGLTITRNVLPVDGSDQKLFDSSNLQVGELLKVIITVRCEEDITFAAINDPFPAGCEAINPQINSGEQVVAQNNTHWTGPTDLSHNEFRDSRVLLFADNMPAGEYRFSYILKVTTAGKFLWPAPFVEAMYYPEFYGRGTETDVIIRDKN